jgi:hypothetical protein
MRQLPARRACCGGAAHEWKSSSPALMSRAAMTCSTASPATTTLGRQLWFIWHCSSYTPRCAEAVSAKPHRASRAHATRRSAHAAACLLKVGRYAAQPRHPSAPRQLSPQTRRPGEVPAGESAHAFKCGDRLPPAPLGQCAQSPNRSLGLARRRRALHRSLEALGVQAQVAQKERRARRAAAPAEDNGDVEECTRRKRHCTPLEAAALCVCGRR